MTVVMTCSPTHSARLLVVDDHRDTCHALARLLQRSGYAVNACNSYEEALALASCNQFDLVISDISMPGRNGLQLMRDLHARYGLVGIAVSALASEGDIREALECGFRAHIAKPADFSEVRSAVGAVVAAVG